METRGQEKKEGFWNEVFHLVNEMLVLAGDMTSLQCFDAVGWVEGRASGL